MPQPLTTVLRNQNIPFVENAKMSEYTTLHVGGPADLLVRARNAEELQTVLYTAKEAQIPVYCVGNGSNLLVLDGGIRGCVLWTGLMTAITRDGDTLCAEAGAPLGAVAKTALSAGLSGMEALSGIPGTIGGAAAMNAGAYDQSLSDIVESVGVLDESGNFQTLSNESLCYAYRTSALIQKKFIAASVTLSLSNGNPEEIGQKMKSFAERRRQSQPLHLPSAGSFFKRPEGNFAGALIERAGLKGASVGGALVSPKHAGFLVNTGDATAQDFIGLMRLVQDRVFQMSGVALEPEVKILGCNSFC